MWSHCQFELRKVNTAIREGFQSVIDYWPESREAVFASYLVRLRLKPKIASLMVGIFVESADYKSYVQSRVGGAAQPNANAKVLSAAEVLLPPPSIQRVFREYVEPLMDQREVLQLQNQQLRAARNLLLPRLMSGEIAV